MPKCRTCEIVFEGSYREWYCSTSCQFLSGVPSRAEGDACWEWQRARSAAGYGVFNVLGVVRYAHRASYGVFHGPVADDLFVCHRCDNPSCVNPFHLFIGTGADNSADMAIKGRAAWAGKKMPVELRKKLSDAQVAKNWRPSPEMLALSVAGRAKKLADPEYKRAVYDKTRGDRSHLYGKPMSEEVRAKLQPYWDSGGNAKGRAVSDETKAKMRASALARIARKKENEKL